MKTSLILLSTIIILSVSGQNQGVIAYSITPSDDNNEIFLINADGTGKTQLTFHEGRDLSPVWSPDASKIAFYAHSPDETKWSIFVMDANGDNIQQLTNEEDIFDSSPTWWPDGTKIVFSREYPLQNFLSEIWIMGADGSNQEPLGSVIGGGPHCSKDGTRIAFHAEDSEDYEIYTMNPDGSNIQQLTFNNSNDLWPAFSPDGNQIAFRSERDGNYEIYKMNFDGQNQTRLTTNPAIDDGPDWSPNGSLIAFDSFRDGNYEIYIMTANGDNQERLTYTDIHAIQPAWRPETNIGINENVRNGSQMKFQVYPNPSNSQTTIKYSLEKQSHVNLSITDSSGKLIKTLVNNKQTAGNYETVWDGTDTYENKVDGGVYFLETRISNKSHVHKLIKQ
jgi:TolB protein